MKSIGICLGATNIKVAILEKTIKGIGVIHTKVIPHESNPRQTFSLLTDTLDLNSIEYGMLTGRKFREMINHPSIPELQAVEYAMAFGNLSGRKRPFEAVVSLGAENFILYVLNRDGTVRSIESGNKCASGTGEFFLQQIRRMNIELSEAVHLARESDIYRVSGRCSVFCKSDCTHALNKGIPVGRVSAGLCYMIADKIIELLEKVNCKEILLTGGVTNNTAVIKFLEDRLESVVVSEHANTFEAIGAAFFALQKKTNHLLNNKSLFFTARSSFDLHPPLRDAFSLVQFKKTQKIEIQSDQTCVVGLDVGSTTTKAVLLRCSDSAILGSVYLKTNGNPVKASQECYKDLADQISAQYTVIGIGTTGSGRQIAGLHAQTTSIINEIIAHATAAAYYDKEVDTIFEIGGQDAKYTHLVEGVPADYAMNEACSAGTGSFLEEAAFESLGVNYLDIEKLALKANAPPNFNDQCAAFINSDVKTATQEGIKREDILAGLVYSVCLNYVNRVKGQRPSGKKIFMQGGVCYNKAVPLAMASIIGKEIIVPPEPGLMGAFGVALEVNRRITLGILPIKKYDLYALAKREIALGKAFRCHGSKESCDRGCEINVLIIEGKKFPFGGACNKYYNLIERVDFDQKIYDHVRVRNNLLFKKFTAQNPPDGTVEIGISRSFLTHQLLPLYSHFFTSLDCNIRLSGIDPNGIKYKRTSYCFPGEIAHGAYFDLIVKKPDYIFLPKISELFVEKAKCRKPEHQSTCLLLQSEPYFLQAAFNTVPDKPQVISPLLDFSQGYDSQAEKFIEIGKLLKKSSEESLKAYRRGFTQQNAFFRALKEYGKRVLANLKRNAEQTGIVLFGRPYNAFATEANLNIPAKFASRGIHIIPWDILDFEDEPLSMDMCWAIGQNLMKASSFVSKDPQLFGVYITNFSCGPDSFLVSYFREIMGSKPSLTLELDSHTADAGINTRIEAFLDIVTRYRALSKPQELKKTFHPASVISRKGKPLFIGSDGYTFPLNHPDIHLLLPSMGVLCSEILAAVFSSSGIRTTSLPLYSGNTLKLGRSVASCKECLPLLLTVGGLLEYLQNRQNCNEKLVYFMPTSPGNCRFTQYSVFLKKLIENRQIENVALLSLTNENGYAGLPTSCLFNALKAVIVSDVMEDIKNALYVLAVNRSEAMEMFFFQWQKILSVFKKQNGRNLYNVLRKVSKELSRIKLQMPFSQAKKVALMGEIFVRRDQFSSQDIVTRLSRNDIVVKKAHFLEWLNYCDWLIQNGIYQADFPFSEWIKFKLKVFLGGYFEKRIKGILAQSGLYDFEMVDIGKVIEYGKQFFEVQLTGEAILVVGDFFKDIIHTTHGIISVGPFACIPTRIVESILSGEANLKTKIRLDKLTGNCCQHYPETFSLPFLSVESDGNPFPQIIEARIETFSLQVQRLWEKCLQQTEKTEISSFGYHKRKKVFSP
jgi:predicted CoA-substrate-specific enzyme activase